MSFSRRESLAAVAASVAPQTGPALRDFDLPSPLSVGNG
jgi:hypothetical protein